MNIVYVEKYRFHTKIMMRRSINTKSDQRNKNQIFEFELKNAYIL